MDREEILKQFRQEREWQEKLAFSGNTEEFDKGNSCNDWLAYIMAYA